MADNTLALLGAEGAVMAALPKRAMNQMAMGVIEMLGGQQRMYELAKRSPDHEWEFIKTFGVKLLVKDVAVDDRRSVDDLILELESTPSSEKAIDAEEAEDAFYE